jgi:alkylation response protein AidB-like acyl-CoA dehydrogenase
MAAGKPMADETEWTMAGMSSAPNAGIVSPRAGFEPEKAVVALPGGEGWLGKQEIADLDSDTLVERVRAIQPLVAAHASATESARRVQAPVWQAIRETGIFYQFVPRQFGGLELGLETFIDVMLPIGSACASSCWVASFTSEHNFLASLFPLECQQEMFGEGRYIVAPGVSNPVGRAVAVSGGYRVTGSYKWGSAVMNSNWVLAMALLEGEGAPTPMWFAIPIEDVQVLDTWFMSGMAGTGSNDIVIPDVFVPAHRALSAEAMRTGTSPGASVHPDSPLYCMPAIPLLSLATSIPTIAAAKGAVALYRDKLLAGRSTFSSQIRQAEKSTAQVRLARAMMQAHAGEILLRDGARRLQQLGEDGDGANQAERICLINQFAHATHTAREAVTLAIGGAGANAYSLDSPFQRIQRDVNVATSHLMHDYDTCAEQYGRSLLELEPISSTF